MRPDEKDAGYLWDMYDAAQSVREFTAGISCEHYLQDKKLRLAVERAVEIIGEAARHVSEPFRQAHPEIRWRAIVAQRHVLAHEYGEIKQERLWTVAAVRVPELIVLLEPLLPPLPPEVP